MIKGYSDHAANERTFLAWVRSGLSFMAAGFVIEKFDLALQGTEAQGPGTWMMTSEVVGLGLILLGVVTLVVSGVRFVETGHQIRDEALHEAGTTWSALALIGVLVCVGVFMFVYVARQLFA